MVGSTYSESKDNRKRSIVLKNISTQEKMNQCLLIAIVTKMLIEIATIFLHLAMFDVTKYNFHSSKSIESVKLLNHVILVS